MKGKKGIFWVDQFVSFVCGCAGEPQERMKNNMKSHFLTQTHLLV